MIRINDRITRGSVMEGVGVGNVESLSASVEKKRKRGESFTERIKRENREL